LLSKPHEYWRWRGHTTTYSEFKKKMWAKGAAPGVRSRRKRTGDCNSKTQIQKPNLGTRLPAKVGLLGGCFWIEKTVGFDELFGGHKTPEGLAASGSEAVTGRASTRVPRICGDVIERHTFTGFVKVPETRLSIDVPLLCS